MKFIHTQMTRKLSGFYFFGVGEGFLIWGGGKGYYVNIYMEICLITAVD